jgi:hypothetical protein
LVWIKAIEKLINHFFQDFTSSQERHVNVTDVTPTEGSTLLTSEDVLSVIRRLEVDVQLIKGDRKKERRVLHKLVAKEKHRHGVTI